MLNKALRKYVNWRNYLEENKLTQDEIIEYLEDIENFALDHLISTQVIAPKTFIQIFNHLNVRQKYEVIKRQKYDFNKEKELFLFLKLNNIDTEFKEIKIKKELEYYDVSLISRTRTFSIEIDDDNISMDGDTPFNLLVLIEDSNYKQVLTVYPRLMDFDDDEDNKFLPDYEIIMSNKTVEFKDRFVMMETRLSEEETKILFSEKNKIVENEKISNKIINIVTREINNIFKNREEFGARLQEIYKEIKKDYS
jgi:hypothetical protein